MDYKNVIRSIVDELDENWDLIKKDRTIENVKNSEYLCLFGLGQYFMDAYPKIKPLFNYYNKQILLCDNDPAKWGKEYYGARCISPNELIKYKDSLGVVIYAITNRKGIYTQLKQMGIDNIIVPYRWMDFNRKVFETREWVDSMLSGMNLLLDILDDDYSKEVAVTVLKNKLVYNICDIDYSNIFDLPQYFRSDVYSINDNESYADIGAYNGDTVEEFLETCDYRFKQIYPFELNINNYRNLEERVNSYSDSVKSKIKLFNIGLWDEKQSVSYFNYGPGSSVLQNAKGNIIGEVNRLDSILGDNEVSLIKIDVEGAEAKALNGARNIITTQKPKLAICGYHKLADLWEIPLLIKSICPQYKMFLRHHSLFDWDTVCYATID